MVKPTFFLGVSAASAASGPFPPSLLLHNATVYTMDVSAPYASAVCLSDGRIQAVGSEESVLGSTCGGKADRVVNLQGATVVPGLTDSHAHIVEESIRRTRADLLDSESAAGAVQAVVEFAESHPDYVAASGGWVQGFGWQQASWPDAAWPTRQDLDTAFPDDPVFLEHVSGHACWVNSKALEIAAADIPATDPEGGHIERDVDGQPTGVFSDSAMYIVARYMPSLPDSVVDAALTDMLADCARHGLTGVHDAMANVDDLERLERFRARGDLSLRVYAMRTADVAEDPEASPSSPFLESDDGLIVAKSVKFVSDGAMGSWSAAMLEPYNDNLDTKGQLGYSTEELFGNMSTWAANGYQIATHAIGDAAVQQVLDVYERLGVTLDLRWRVEHAQILATADVPRFASLGVIPSMQPSHCASDLPYALDRLGADRASRSYAWMTLLETGVQALPFGSDFPAAGSVPPLLGLHAAITRETEEGMPSGGWFPGQRVTPLQVLKGYTADAAFASFREDELGSLMPGFYADLTIFDRDILTVDAPLILEASILGTVVGGRVVYAATGTGLSDLSRPHERSVAGSIQAEMKHLKNQIAKYVEDAADNAVIHV